MTNGRFLYFINGLGVGIAMTLLWAPKSGAATRRALKQAASEGQDFMGEQAKNIQKQAKNAQQTVQDTLQRGMEAAKTTTDGVAEAFGAGKSVLLR